MAQWKCQKCGFEKEGRCKPRNCPSCNETRVFIRADV